MPFPVQPPDFSVGLDEAKQFGKQQNRCMSEAKTFEEFTNQFLRYCNLPSLEFFPVFERHFVPPFVT